jgi:hypothetical protein
VNLLFRNIVSLLLLSFYLASGALIELTHHDKEVFASSSGARLHHHDCGGPEKHPAPEASHCLACAQANHRVAIEPQSHLSPRTLCVVYGRIVNCIGQTLDTDVFHSGKRGPPPFCA